LSASENQAIHFFWKNGKVEESAVERLIRASFNVATDLSRDLLSVNTTMPSEYDRNWKFVEVKKTQMGDVKALKSNGLKQLSK